MSCKKARKKKAQEAWTEKNPGYFQGRYPYVKAWRQGRKMIQDKIPPKNPYVELIIRIPAKKKDMIQDEIRLIAHWHAGRLRPMDMDRA